MANEVKIKITSDNTNAKAGLKDTAKDLADAEKAAGSAGKAYEELTRSMTETDKIGSKLSETLRTQKKVKGTDFFDEKPDPGFVQKLTSNITGAIEKAPALVQGGGAIGLALAPTIASGIATGLTGAVGIGFIGGGIALIAKDPAISGAAKKIGTTFKDEITTSARTWFTGPVLNSLNTFSGVAKRTAPEIGAAFQAVAPSIDHLTGNVSRLAESLIGDLSDAAQKSGSSINALGDLIEHTGESVGDLISGLSDNADGGVSSINDLDDKIQTLLSTIGGGLNVLAEVNSFLDKFGLNIVSAVDPTNLLREAIAPLSDGTQTFSKHTIEASDATDDLGNAMTNAERAAEGQLSAMQALSGEMKAETDPVFALLDAQDKLEQSQHNATAAAREAKDANHDVAKSYDKYEDAVRRSGEGSNAAKAALKKYNEAVRESGEKSDDAKTALRNLAKSAIDLEGKAGALGDKFDGTMTPALRSTLKAAGATDKEIDQLGKQFVDAKRDGDRFAKNYKANASVSGTDGAGRRIRSITDDLRDFQGTWTATMITNYKTFGKPGSHGGLAHGGIKGAASGMVAGDLTWVGENGPELAQLPVGSTVRSSGDSMRMMRQGMMGGGGGTQDIVLHGAPNASHNLMQVIIESLRYEVRSQYGSVNNMLNPVGVN